MQMHQIHMEFELLQNLTNPLIIWSACWRHPTFRPMMSLSLSMNDGIHNIICAVLINYHTSQEYRADEFPSEAIHIVEYVRHWPNFFLSYIRSLRSIRSFSIFLFKMGRQTTTIFKIVLAFCIIIIKCAIYK